MTQSCSVVVEGVGAVGPPGATGPAGPAGPGGGVADQVVVRREAATDLSGHRLVAPVGGGQVAYADASDPSHINRPVWMTKGAAAAGTQVELLVFGEFVEPSWAWAPGPIYLSTAGGFTQTSPTEPGSFILQVATSFSLPTVIFFDPKSPTALT